MISVSFYLLTPNAVSQSQVYVSISNKEKRLRFATGKSFITSYCNVRKKKGTKNLVKKNTTFYFEYDSQLKMIRDGLIRIEIDLSKTDRKPTLEEIRDIYYLQSGKMKPAPLVTLEVAFNKFLAANQSEWSGNTLKKITGTLNHLIKYEETFGTISLENLSSDFWYSLRDNYFVGEKKFSNPSTNKYLKIVKQFLRYAKKVKIMLQEIDLDELKYLEEIEPFKIALKLDEVETLMNLDLSNDLRLDKVRDLFCLEIFTAQRFGDMPKLLDKNNISATHITIYQEKTNEKVSIPLHPKLKKHLTYIFNKYPTGLPTTISNQKFNEYLKEICKEAKFKNQHSWVTLTGKKKIPQKDFRYNLISSHTGRRTFCTLALKSGISPELIMKVTGHRTYKQFREYVKVDDEDLELAFDGMFNTKNKTTEK